MIAAKEESSIFVAGVPSKRRRWTTIAAALVVLGVLLGTGSLLNIYFERDTKGAGIVAGGTTNALPPAASDREAIPPPDPAITAAAAPVVNANDLPMAPPPVARQASKTVVSPSQLSANLGAPPPEASPAQPPSTPIPAAAPTVTSKKPIDKDEIF